MATIPLIGSDATVIQLLESLYGLAPGYNILTADRTYLTTHTTNEYVGARASAFSSLTNAQFADLLMTNTGLAALSAANPAALPASTLTAYLNAVTAGASDVNLVRGVVALQLAQILSSLANIASTDARAIYIPTATAFNNTTANAYTYSTVSTNTTPAAVSSTEAGQGFTLTTGADVINGASGNDTINGAEAPGPVATWSIGDVINGGDGTDVFTVTQTAAITNPLSATVTNVEVANMTSGTTGTSLNTSTWTGLTTLAVTAPGAVGLTAATTTDVNLTDAAVGAADASVTANGGRNVAMTLSGTTNDGDANAEIVVGGTTAPAGTVTITNSFAGANGNDQADIAVTGGSTVSVTESLTNAVNTTNTHGTVTVTGNASTTAVTVTQDRAATAGATVAGKVNGAVTIADANATTATGDTIATVTLNNYGASTIASDVLANLNLTGTGSTLGVNGGGADATQTATALTMNVNGLTGAAISLSDPYTTLNIASSTAASTIANVTAAGVTALNISGDARLTLTNNTFGALSAVTVTNTAGVTLGTTALATGVTFNGGSGADSVILSNAFTKAINMGAGNDTVTFAGLPGAGGSATGGDGTDTIAMTAAQADTADNDATFNTKFTSFEVLDIATGATNTTINLAGVGAINNIVTRGVAAGNTLTIQGLTSGGTLALDAAAANATTSVVDAQVTNAILTPADTFNVVLSNSTAGSVGFGKVTLAGIETVNISTVDAGTGANTAATVDTAVLAATSATSIVVGGNNGLTLTNTGNTAVTSFNASGVGSNSADDTAANLAVTFTSANTTAAATVTITGGAGNDTLTGNASKDVINGNAGNDIITGGTNQDTLTVGSGRDAIVIAADQDTGGGGAAAFTDSGTAAPDIVNGFGLLSSAITTATDVSTVANFQAAAVGGTNASVLSLDADQDASATTDQPLAVEGNATGAGQAVGTNYTVTNGVLTLSGAGAAAVDTLAEWLGEAAAVAATDGDVIAFVFGNDTYVFAQNGAADILVQLVGVQATSLVEGGAATTASAGAVVYVDVA